MFKFWGQIGWKTYFWKIWVEFKCFWKTFNLILVHFIHEILCLRSFCIKLLCFFRFSIDRICCSTYRKCDKNFGLNLPGSIDAQLIEFNFWSIEPVSQPIETEKFSIFKYLTNLFFHASFMFRIHMHYIDFFFHLAVLQSYLSLFHT